MLKFRRLLVLACSTGLLLASHETVVGQQSGTTTATQSILAIEEVDSDDKLVDDQVTDGKQVEAPSPSDAGARAKLPVRTAVDRVTGSSTSAPVALTSAGKKSLKATRGEAEQTELVRDRYPSGKPRIERYVTLDAEGNFVNHGEYRELSEKGELLVTGTYNAGERVGVWARFLQAGDAKILATSPFNKFRAPFSSTVEFQANRMNGVWVISDRDKRIACQIEMKDGTRHGSMTFYHANGQIYLQANFDEGVLNGLSIEKNQDGKLVHEDHYTAGRKLVIETEHYPNKSVKSVTRTLTAPQRAATPDNWDTTTLASYTSAGNTQLHGEFVTYHENGQVATKGTYEHGKLHGAYESWYKTGEPSASGTYDAGTQVGEWTWRHANGMKRAVASYVDGKVQGETRAWDEAGKAVAGSTNNKADK